MSQLPSNSQQVSAKNMSARKAHITIHHTHAYMRQLCCWQVVDPLRPPCVKHWWLQLGLSACQDFAPTLCLVNHLNATIYVSLASVATATICGVHVSLYLPHFVQISCYALWRLLVLRSSMLLVQPNIFCTGAGTVCYVAEPRAGMAQNASCIATVGLVWHYCSFCT